MKAILIVILCAQAAIVLTTAYATVIRKPTAEKPHPIWISFATSLFIVGMASQSIAQGHAGELGADWVANIGLVLIGMSIMALLLLVRDKRRLDAAVAG
ncbi:MAG TPA: hypothetical protein VFI88_01700 [Sphingomicrobium sp.]|jgi:drug/metabolite transporter (DMT)-like permease|nr:hypothetical protein [Sphingomicrobium sp.]